MIDENIMLVCDVGSAKICALVAEITENDAIKVIGYGESIPHGIKKGIIVNLDNTVKSIEKAVEEAEHMADHRAEHIYVSISGAHMNSENNSGSISISGANKEITEEDVRRVCDDAKRINLPSNREIVHVITKEFVVDGQDGIKDPVGMAGTKLGTEAHIVTGLTTTLQNFQKCITSSNLVLDRMIYSPLASAEAVLTEDEKSLGSIVIDIGAGTTDIAVFVKGNIVYSATIAVGGDHVTNDMAIGLRTTLKEAEKLKITKGSAITDDIPESEKIEVLDAGQDKYNVHSRYEICSIIEARMDEIFRLVREKIQQSGYKEHIKSGVVLTGGASLLTNNDKLCEKILEFPVRIGKPTNIQGLTEKVKSPAHATAVGLLKYTFNNYIFEVVEEIPMNGFGWFWSWLKGLFG